MKKYLLLFGALLSACGQKTENNIFVDEFCLQGVVYYTIGYAATPAFKPDGTLYTCQGK